MLYVLTLCIITLKQHFHLLFLRFTCIFILFDSSISEKNFSVCPNKEVIEKVRTHVNTYEDSIRYHNEIMQKHKVNINSIFIFVFLKCCVLITLYFFRSFSFMTLHPVLLRLTCTSSFILAVRCVKAIADAKGNGTCGI